MYEFLKDANQGPQAVARGAVAAGAISPSVQALQRQSVQLNAAFSARIPYQAKLDLEEEQASSQDQSDVSQLVVAQILTGRIDKDKAIRILKLTLVGRPGNVFTDSAGDHTSAFTLHEYGLRARLEGLTIPQAVAEMDRLVFEMTRLPGYALVENLSEGQDTEKGRTSFRISHLWCEAVEQLQRIRGDIEENMDGEQPTNWWVSALQSYIVAYLEVRERVPLSTIMTKLLNISAGKNKNESGGVLYLRQHDRYGTREEVVDAIFRNFDIQSAVGAVVEQEPFLLGRVAPGVVSDQSPQYRLEMFARQHAMTLAMYYPDVISDLAENFFYDLYLRSPEAAREEVVDQIAEVIMLNAKAESQKHLEEMRGEALFQLEYVKDPSTKIEKSHREYMMGMWNDRLNQIDDFSDTKSVAKEKIVNESIVDKTALADKGPSVIDEEIPKSKKRSRIDYEKFYGQGDDDFWDNGSAYEKITKKVCKETLTTGAILNKDGLIQEVNQSGRPPHRFRNSAGAHTSAHLIYRDLVERSLIGKTIEQALAEMVKLRAQYDKVVKRLKDFPMGPDDVAPQKLKGRGGPKTLDRLQDEITDLMLAFELVPGVTLPGVATGGLGEGAARQVLLEHEEEIKLHTTEELTSAVLSLLDVGAVMEGTPVEADDNGNIPDYSEENLISMLLHNHIGLIVKTYPKVAVTLSLSEKSSRKLWVAKLMNPDGFERAHRVGGKDTSRYRKTPKDFDKRSRINLDLFNFGKGKAFASSEETLSSLDGFDLSWLMGRTKGDKVEGSPINNAYQYEDLDMYQVLLRQTEGLPHLAVLPPVDSMYIDQLSQRLGEIRTGDAEVRTFLVPFNLGNYHWVGIIIRMLPLGVVQYGYFDPLSGDRPIPGPVLNQIRDAFSDAASIEPQANLNRLTQTDGTSCGPITVQNLMLHVLNTPPADDIPQNAAMTRAIRDAQAQLLEEESPGFIARQEANESSISSSFDVSQYLSGKGARAAYSPQEWRRVLEMGHLIRRLNPDSAAPLLAVLQDVDLFLVHQPFLAELRKALFKVMTEVKKDEDLDQRAIFNDLLINICGVTLEAVEMLPNFNDLGFRDYEELRSLALYLNGKNLEKVQEDVDVLDQQIGAQKDKIGKLAEAALASKKK